MAEINLNERISQSENLIHWLDRLIEGKSVPTNERAVIVAGCLNLSLEHHKSIVLTTTAEFYGSALALVRLQFEAYIRGVWLLYCATDQAIEKFKNDKLDVSMGTMINALEKKDAFNIGVLSNIKNDSWSAMNSFTHTGGIANQQVLLRYRDWFQLSTRRNKRRYRLRRHVCIDGSLGNH